MSITPMDLDSSLDDLIKKRKQRPSNNNNHNNNNKRHSPKTSHQQVGKQQSLHSRLSPQTKAKVTKPTAPQRGGINARLSTSSTPIFGPIFTSKNQPRTEKEKGADPSQIIITKALPSSPSSSRSRLGAVSERLQSRLGNSTMYREKEPARGLPEKSMLRGRLGTQTPVNERVETNTYVRPDPVLPIAPSSSTPRNFSIRGRSNVAVQSTGLSIKDASGPTLLLVAGLHEGTNSEDLREAMLEYGNVLRCEVLRDREGRSYGEAEVEYSTKSAALDCIAALDNQMADGKYLRLIIRENKKLPKKSVQSVISTPAYIPSGRLYSDRESTSRYDIRRQ